MIDEIIKQLFLSDATSVISLKGQEELKRLQISHILTVSAMCIPERSQIPGIEYKFLFALDMATQDMFSNNRLTEALNFIETALNDGGNVLVHCELGFSRSAFIIAAFLMRKYRWTVDKALTHIRSCRPNVKYAVILLYFAFLTVGCFKKWHGAKNNLETLILRSLESLVEKKGSLVLLEKKRCTAFVNFSPNDGFIRQLMIFHNLGYKADFDCLSHCSEYRNWCYSTGHIYQMMPVDNGEKVSKTGETEFICRKCKKILFYDDHLLKHAPKEESDESNSTGQSQNECSFGFLLTPMKWMDLSAYEGKVFCPSCHEKLGNYVWGGRVCFGADGKACGTAVRPWVQIHKGKVDKKVYRKDNEPTTSSLTVFKPPTVLIEPQKVNGTKQDKQDELDDLSLEALSVEEAGGRLTEHERLIKRKRSKSLGSTDVIN